MVPPFTIVKSKIFVQTFVKRKSVFISMQLNMFILYGSPKLFNENIVNGSAFTIHADLYAVLFKQVYIYFTRKLAALFTVDDGWFALKVDGKVHYFSTPFGSHGFTYPPVNHIAGIDISIAPRFRY